MRVAAVVERPMGHALLVAISTLPEAELLEGAREAVAHQVLVSHPDGTYAFRHALVGEAIFEDLLPGERTALHAALAERARARPRAARRPPPGDVRRRAGVPLARRARPAARARGRRSRPGSLPGRVFAYGEALRHFERALELWDRVPDAAERAGMPRADVLRAAAAAAGDAFEAGRAVALQREALADGAPGADPVRLLAAARRAGARTCGTRASTTRATTSCGWRSTCSPTRPSSSARSCAPRRPRD